LKNSFKDKFKRLCFEVVYIALILADVCIRIRQLIRQRFARRNVRAIEIDKLTREYCEFNKSHLKPVEATANAFVLMDCFPIPVWVVVNGILAHHLAERHAAKNCSYGVSARDPLTDALYESFGCRSHLLIRLSATGRKRRRKLFVDTIASLKSKKDLFYLSINGVQIGDEIYETFLRMFSKHTAELGSFKCGYAIFIALNYYLFFESFFAKNKVSAVVLSHDIYISMGILAKIAWRNGIPVYLANGYEMKMTTGPDQKFQEFSRYHEYFSRLPLEAQEKGIAWGKAQIAKRLGGDVGVNMGYSTKSAYTAEKLERQTLASNRTKIVIATHCFFDNPRAYGGMLFTDFYEWITFLGQISEITDYDWYIKTHRDYLPGTMEAIKLLCERWPKLKLINPSTTWHQLKEEGISIALTCYGSIGHELPLLGYKVINAGYNPHIAYNFNWHGKTLDEYRDLLLNLNGLGEIRDLEAVYEFYFVHYNLSKQGGFLFNSFEEMENYVGKDVNSNLIFERVIAGGQNFQDEAKRSINTFLDSGNFSVSEMLILSSSVRADQIHRGFSRSQYGKR